MNDYLPIKDFAEQAGRTPTAIYQQTETRLKPFTKLEKGKKVVDIAALKFYKDQPLQTLDDLNQIDEMSRLYDPSAYMEGLKSQINTLTEEKNRLQDELFKSLEELSREREHSRNQSDKLSDLAGQIAKLMQNNQVLLGAEQSRTNPILLNDGEKKVTWKFWRNIFH